MNGRYWGSLSAMLLVVFLGAQVYSMVFPIRQFSWLEFSDEDDSFQVEQFLRISGESKVPALLDNPVSHGSELLAIGPLYGKIREHFRLSPLCAFYFLKILHMGCAFIALGCLPWMVRRTGGPAWVGPLSIAWVVFNPLFFNNAPLLKEDANMMLAAVMFSVMCLLQFDETRRKRWLVISIGAAAIGAAVKWWGVFLLPAQIYSVATRETDRPLLTRKMAILLNGFVGILWLGTAVIQWRYLNRFFPEYARFLPSLPIVVFSIVIAITAVISIIFWIDKLRCFGAKWIKAGVSVGVIFAFFFSFSLAPLLSGPEFPHSVRYFSKYLGIRSSSSGFFGGLWHNISGWWATLRLESGISWPLVILLIGSIVLWARGQISSIVRRQLLIMALWIVPLISFLLLFVTKFNPPTLALMFPFVVLIALVPVSRYGTDGPARARPWVLSLILGLSLYAFIFQIYSITSSIREARMLPENVISLNRQLEAGLPKGKLPGILALGREFPFMEGHGNLIPMDRLTLEGKIGDLVEGCSDGSNSGPVVVVLGESRKGVMGPALERLETSPCVEKIWDLAVDSQKRGHLIRRIYRAVLWTPPGTLPLVKQQGRA